MVVVVATKPIKPEKAAGPFEVLTEIISACGKVGISVMLNFATMCWLEKECWTNSK